MSHIFINRYVCSHLFKLSGNAKSVFKYALFKHCLSITICSHTHCHRLHICRKSRIYTCFYIINRFGSFFLEYTYSIFALFVLKPHARVYIQESPCITYVTSGKLYIPPCRTYRSNIRSHYHPVSRNCIHCVI